MLPPSLIDQWYAEAITRVYAPWLTSTCVGIGDRRRHEISELIRPLRQAACLPPLGAPAVRPVPMNPFANQVVQPSRTKRGRARVHGRADHERALDVFRRLNRRRK